jgi:mRNA-degrading endonuclease RelE of RelBE toxin-antitoxin system
MKTVVMKKEKETLDRVNIIISKAHREKLRKLAYKQRKSMSEIIRGLIENIPCK